MTTAAEDFVAHFGVKGMHWGVRRREGGSGSPVSSDSAAAEAHKAVVKKHGTSALSNNDLKQLVDRMNLEQQYSRLNPEEISAGKKTVHSILGIGGSVAKTQAVSFGNKYAAQGINHLISEAAKTSAQHNRNKPLKLISIG